MEKVTLSTIQESDYCNLIEWKIQESELPNHCLEKIEINLLELLEFLKEELENDLQSNENTFKLYVLLKSFFTIISEFFILKEILEDFIKEYNLESSEDNHKFSEEMKKISYFCKLKILCCFNIDEELYVKYLCNKKTKNFSPEKGKKIISSMLKTLVLLDDINKENITDDSIDLPYILNFNVEYSLFTPSQFNQMIEKNLNYINYEKIIENLRIINDIFYRDHFIHSFFVSALLLYIVNKIDDILPDNLNRHLLNLVGLFHDDAYPIEEITSLLPKFLEPIEEIFPIKFNFSDIFTAITSKQNIVDEEIENEFISKYFITPICQDNEINDNFKKILQIAIKTIILSKECDHGYISSLSLFSNVKRLSTNSTVIARFGYKFNLDENELNKIGITDFIPKIFENVFYSIALHNIKFNKGDGVELLFNNDTSKFISLLNLVDNLQHWRRTPTKDYDNAILESLSLDTGSLKIKLKYIFNNVPTSFNRHSIEDYFKKIFTLFKFDKRSISELEIIIDISDIGERNIELKFSHN